jgi:hypothetical protein
MSDVVEKGVAKVAGEKHASHSDREDEGVNAKGTNRSEELHGSATSSMASHSPNPAGEP